MFTNDTSLIPNADKAFQLVESNIDGDGWLRDTVDPETFDSPSAADSPSPEGQAFVLLLQAAYSDYAEAVISGQVLPSSNSSASSGSEGSGDDDDDGSILRRCRLVRSH